MKKIILAAACILAIFISCKQAVKDFRNKYINVDNLPLQVFVINSARDTTITTIKGIKISVPANSIQAKNNKITLQIKEALSLDDMIKGGLTTTGRNEILSSDGMFDITTKEDAIIKKPMEISVPTFFADSNMRLYKGDNKSGKLNWQNPVSISSLTNVTD